MKINIKILLMASCVSIVMTSCSTMKSFLTNASIAIGGAIIHETAVREGMSDEEAAQSISSIADAMGLNKQSVDVGIAWKNNTLNRYDKQNIIGDVIFDGLAEVGGSPELMNAFKELKTANCDYLSAKHDIYKKVRRGENVDMLALDKANYDRMQKIYNVVYNSYEYAKDKKAQYLSEKLALKNRLLANGYTDPELACEVAGTIMAIYQSDDLTMSEKENLVCRYGLCDMPEVESIVNEVLRDDFIYEDSGIENIPQQNIEEINANREKEYQDAISRLESTVINGYLFDETELSDEQKCSLDRVAEIMNKYAIMKISITGHTCDIGYKNINRKKGLQRAEACRIYLVERGVSASRILVDTRGEEQPLYSNTNGSNRRLNRRVEFVVE